MSKLPDIIDNLNLPKQILDKSEKVMSKLFGPSLDEFGQTIADQVRLRRFRNQIKIFTKAEKLLKEKKISPQKVSLKVLAPLLDLSSYEEDENIQEKWTYLTVHILSDNSDTVFQQNCLTILNRISSKDSKLLDELFNLFEKKRNQKNKNEINQYVKYIHKNPFSARSLPKKPDEFNPNNFPLKLSTVVHTLEIDQTEFEFSLSNLITLGLLRWDTNVQVSAFKSKDIKDEEDMDLKVKVLNNDKFVFTPLGVKFMTICTNA